MTIFFGILSSPVFAKDLVDPDLVQSQNKFALKAFLKAHETSQGNKLFAPLGTATLLRLFYQTARGPAQQEMTAVLEVEGTEPEAVANRNAGLWMLSRNAEKEQVEYFSPMSFLGSQETSVVEDFQRKAAFFKVMPRSYDLKHPYMTYTINDWVKNNTGKKILSVTEKFDSSSPLAIFEAFYFQGKWRTPFEEEKQPAPFTAKGGSQKPVSFMSSEGNFEFYREDHFEAVSLPYGTGRYGLFVFLPSKNSSLEAFVSGLDVKNLNSWLEGFLDRPGKVRMPLFTVESSWDLREILKALGMRTAFSESGDFRQAFTNAFGRTYLGSFEQKAFFVAGTDSMPAAAPVPQDIDASPRHERFSFSADRPFFFLIQDNKTKVWLALGTVTALD